MRGIYEFRLVQILQASYHVNNGSIVSIIEFQFYFKEGQHLIQASLFDPCSRGHLFIKSNSRIQEDCHFMTSTSILHYALGLRFGNLKRSKTREKTQPARVLTQRIV